MKAIKYVLAGALVLSTALPVKAQDVKAPIDAITKVVIDAKGDVKATKDAVKEFTKHSRRTHRPSQVSDVPSSMLATKQKP